MPLRRQTSVIVRAAAPPSSTSCRPTSSTRSQASRLRACFGSRTTADGTAILTSCPPRSDGCADARSHLLELVDDLAWTALTDLLLEERRVVEHEVPCRAQGRRRVVEDLAEDERLL